MKIDLVFLIVLGFVVAYIFMLHKVETMADVGSLDQIKAAIREIYLADVEAIRNLSEVATKLQAGGIGVPGNLIMKGPILTDHNIPHPDAGDGAIYRAEGQLTVAADDLIRFRSSSKKQNTIEMNVNDGSLNLTGNVVLNTGIQNPNGQLRISNQGIMFGGPNADREVNSGQITAGLHRDNSLCIVGMSKDKGAASRRVDMWAEGGFNLNGPLNLGSTTLTEDILKRIINQQSYAGFAIDGDGSTMPLYEGSHSLYGDAQFNAWTNDKWDVIYINRGWRITLWWHALGDKQAAVGENRSSNVPTKLGLPANEVSSYKAEWIGY